MWLKVHLAIPLLPSSLWGKHEKLSIWVEPPLVEGCFMQTVQEKQITHLGCILRGYLIVLEHKKLPSVIQLQ